MTNPDEEKYCTSCAHQETVFPKKDRWLHEHGFPSTGEIRCGLKVSGPVVSCDKFVKRKGLMKIRYE